MSTQAMVVVHVHRWGHGRSSPRPPDVLLSEAERLGLERPPRWPTPLLCLDCGELWARRAGPACLRQAVVMNGTGQGVIGRDCAWCGLPAVVEVEVQPAQYRTVSRVDPVSGERTGYRQLVRGAIVVSACDEHQQITRGQPGPVWIPRDGRAREVDQLGLFVTDQEARLRNAIYREVGR